MKKTKGETTSKPRKPMLSPEARESYMISLAMDAAEKQFREGTASSQVITHFLKLATVKYEGELEKLQRENELLKAKTESLQAEQNRDEIYLKAIEAMKRYGGHRDETDEY